MDFDDDRDSTESADRRVDPTGGLYRIGDVLAELLARSPAAPIAMPPMPVGAPVAAYLGG